MGDEAANIEDSSKQQFLCVHRTHEKSKQHLEMVTFDVISITCCLVEAEQVPGKYCERNCPATMRRSVAEQEKDAPKNGILGSRWKSHLGLAD